MITNKRKPKPRTKSISKPRVKSVRTPLNKTPKTHRVDVNNCLRKLRPDNSPVQPTISNNSIVSDMKSRVHYLLEMGHNEDYILNSLCTMSKTLTHNNYEGKQTTVENPHYVRYISNVKKIISDYKQNNE